MPGPLVAALPWVGSILGSLLPAIIDAFRSSKTPEEAQKKVQPKYDEMVQMLIGGGMNEDAAHKAATELIKPEMEKALEAEPMNPLLSIGLSVLGGVGGFKGGAKLGKMLKGTGAAKAAGAAGATRAAAPDALRLGHDPRVSPSRTPDVIKAGMDEKQVGTPRMREVEATVHPEGPFPRLGHDGIERATPHPIRKSPGDERQFLGAKHQPSAQAQAHDVAPEAPFPAAPSSKSGYLTDDVVEDIAPATKSRSYRDTGDDRVGDLISMDLYDPPKAVKSGNFPKRAPAKGGPGATMDSLMEQGLTEEQAIKAMIDGSVDPEEFAGVSSII